LVLELLREKVRLFLARFTESGTSCLLVMVGGNVNALTLSHWSKAFQTGAVSAAILVVLSFTPLKRWTSNGLLTAITVTLATTIADYLVHPGKFSLQSLEAIITGLGAGALYLLFLRWRARTPSSKEVSKEGAVAKGE
jgi:ABC-type enterobactin transport system permease subunit